MGKLTRIAVIAVLIMVVVVIGIRIPENRWHSNSVQPYPPPPPWADPDDATPAPPGTGPDGLFATWAAISFEGLGKKVSGRREAGMWLTFSPDKLVWTFRTFEGTRAYDAVYHIASDKSPKEIDLGEPAQPEPKKMMLGIYKIEGNKLTVYAGAVRPKAFTDEAMFRFELKRVRGRP